MKKSSFSIVREDESDVSNKSISDEEDLQPLSRRSTAQFKYPDKLERVKIEDDDSEEDAKSPKKKLAQATRHSAGKEFSLLSDLSERKSAYRKSDSAKVLGKMSSDSDLEDSDNEEVEKKSIKVPNEYNPGLYEDLDVDDEVKELFQYIVKYMPQQLTLDYKFKPFIPDYLPAVGDIDAFLKVIPAESYILNEHFNNQDQQLGFAILDEPATVQSDSALLHLQLRASTLEIPQDSADVVVKKVEKVNKNQKVVEKWIKDISDLHKSKSSPIVRYAEPMPDIDDLMQEWSEEMELRLKEHGFPSPEPGMMLTEYAELVCDIFGIPTNKNKIHSIHLLFSLYAAVKGSKLYKPLITTEEKSDTEAKESQPDQLVLD
ncbi:hypothetical protein WA026_005491 [Henosepilachna vigintioctopunctata]|uniref:Intraflagellar transport protein 46 homolog n=1 Tax=Henosepilachna vigintioctopunctata TaxID=420089 RepID=A0AAW1U3C8_9CUCU